MQQRLGGDILEFQRDDINGLRKARKRRLIRILAACVKRRNLRRRAIRLRAIDMRSVAHLRRRNRQHTAKLPAAEYADGGGGGDNGRGEGHKEARG